MGFLKTTVTGWQEGDADCVNCGTPTFEVTAYNDKEIDVTLIDGNGKAVTGVFTPKQLYELASLSAQVLVAQMEARRAS